MENIRPKLHVMVGLPRSGKSTYIQYHFVGNIPVISADQLRMLTHGKRYDASREEEVWRIREIALRALLEQRIDIAIDETNITKKRRRRILALAEQYGYATYAYVFHTEPELCKKRAIDTGLESLIPVIDEMAQNQEPVEEEEGFVNITNFRRDYLPIHL